jgi:hypothetical protein
MKFAWRKNMADYAAINSSHIEEFELEEFVDLYVHDVAELELDEGFAGKAIFGVKMT